MAQSFPETAHLRIDRKQYQEGYEAIFGKKKDLCRECKKELTEEESALSYYCEEHEPKKE